MEEADNPPASSCRAPLPAGVLQTPGTTGLGMKTTKTMNRGINNFTLCYLNCVTQETHLERLKKGHDTLAPMFATVPERVDSMTI